MSHVITSRDFFPRLDPGDGELLASRGWLSERAPGFRRALLSHAVSRRYQPDEAIYRHGDTADGLHGICSGTVRITVPADNGQDYEANRESAGYWIGDLAQFSDEPRLVTVVATTPVRTVFVPLARIQELVQRDPPCVADFYALTYRNMQTALRLLANLAVAQSGSRLSLRLLHLDETLADGNGWIAVSQGDLAAMIAVSMPTLQRALRGLSEAGMVEMGYGRLRIIDRAALIARGQD